MKYLYGILLLLSGFVAHSQTLRVNSSIHQNVSHTDSLWYTHQEYVNHVFGQLNMSEVTTNFLLQRSLSYFDPLAHDGKLGNDSTVHSFSEGMQLYNTLYYAALDTSEAYGLPHPSIFRSNAKAQAGQSYIAITLLNLSYHSIASNALLSGLFSANVDSTALYDVPGRPFSPYEKHRLFATFGASKGDAYHSNGDVKFKIAPTSLYLTDTTSTALEIDFGDGNGYVNATPNSTKSIFYGSSGIKIIKVKQGGLESAFSFSFVKEAVYFEAEPVPCSEEFQSMRTAKLVSSAPMPWLTQFLGCDRILDKPILLVEGFEIEEEETAEEILSKINRQNLVGRLLNQGYDFVVVKFVNNSASIIDNAGALGMAIEYINSIKADANKLNVIGLSMGGLIAKYCLKDMEDNNINHNVENYFSFDAPHQGAYLPLGLQHLLEDASYAVRDIREDPKVADLLGKLNSAAGKELLQLHSNDLFNQRGTFAAAYAAKGYPTICNNYGIANGRGDGVGLNYPEGTQLMDMNGYAKVWLLGKVLKHQQQLWSLSTTGSTISYMSNKGLAAILGLKGLKVYSSRVSGSAPQSMETIPGSLVNMHTLYGQGLAASFREIGGSTVNFFGRQTTTFVATASALDLNNQNYSTNNLYLPRNPYYNIEANDVVSNHITPFKAIVYPASSLGHLDINTNISDFIFTKIYGSNDPSNCQTLCNNIPEFVGVSQDCSSGEKTITMKNGPNGVAINWVPPAGLSIIRGQGTNSITFISTSNGPFEGYVQLTPPGCPTMNFPFSVSMVPVISGPAMVCDVATYSIPNVPADASVTWSVDYSFVEIISSNNGQVTLSRSESGFFKLKAVIVTSCGSYEVETPTITSGQPYLVSAEAYCEDGCGGPDILCTEGGPYSEFNNILTYQASVNPIFPLTLHYKFIAQNGYLAFEDSRPLNSASGYLYLPQNLAPDFYNLIVWVTGGPCNTPSEPYDIWLQVAGCNSNRIVAYPNPASTELKVGFRDLSANKSKSAVGAAASRLFNVKLLDEQGRVLRIGKNTQGQDQISLPVSDLPTGAYFLHIFEGKSVDKQQIIINR